MVQHSLHAICIFRMTERRGFVAPHDATFSRYMDSGAYTDFEKTRLLGTRSIFVSTNLSMLYITMLYKVAIQLGM